MDLELWWSIPHPCERAFGWDLQLEPTQDAAERVDFRRWRIPSTLGEDLFRTIPGDSNPVEALFVCLLDSTPSDALCVERNSFRSNHANSVRTTSVAAPANPLQGRRTPASTGGLNFRSGCPTGKPPRLRGMVQDQIISGNHFLIFDHAKPRFPPTAIRVHSTRYLTKPLSTITHVRPEKNSPNPL